MLSKCGLLTSSFFFFFLLLHLAHLGFGFDGGSLIPLMRSPGPLISSQKKIKTSYFFSVSGKDNSIFFLAFPSSSLKIIIISRIIVKKP
jgi:hypothetical protein